MEDDSVIMLISSDEEDDASQLEAEKKKCTVNDKAVTGRCHRSGLVFVDNSGLNCRTTRKGKRKKFNCAPQDKIDDIAVNEKEKAEKLEDVEIAKAVNICESAEKSADAIMISSSSEEDEGTDNLNNCSIDEGIYVAQSTVDVVNEEVKLVAVKSAGIESTISDVGNIVKEGNQVKATKSINKLKLKGKNTVEEKKNPVLQKLLRGPRYFDPHGRNREKCGHCGEEGHKAFMCASKARTKPCFVCAGFGHHGKNCKKTQECFKCKERGHYAKHCPYKNEENCPSSNICLRCGDSGHDMWACNNDYPQEDIKELQCSICKNFGHLCCINYPDLGSRKITCCNCGQAGHAGPECTKGIANPSVVVPKSSKSCHRCGKNGHFARSCRKRARIEKPQIISKGKNASPVSSKSAPSNLSKSTPSNLSKSEPSNPSKAAPSNPSKAVPANPSKFLSNSAPSNVNKGNKTMGGGSIKTPYEEKASTSTSKSTFQRTQNLVWRAPNNADTVYVPPTTTLLYNQNPHPQNPIQMFNPPPIAQPYTNCFQERAPFFEPRDFWNPPNRMFNQFGSPPFNYYPPIPQNHVQMLNNNQEFPPRQVYRPPPFFPPPPPSNLGFNPWRQNNR